MSTSGFKFGEPFEPLRKLCFGVFARSVEGRWPRVTEPGHLPAADRDVALMKIVQAVTRAHSGRLAGRFVIAGQDVDFVAARAKNLAATIEALAPTYLIARGDIKIGLDGEQALESFPIVMNVGEDLQFQFRNISRSFAVCAHGTRNQPEAPTSSVSITRVSKRLAGLK